MEKKINEARIDGAVGCAALVFTAFLFVFLCTVASLGGAFIVRFWNEPVSFALAVPLILFTWFAFRGLVNLVTAFRAGWNKV